MFPSRPFSSSWFRSFTDIIITTAGFLFTWTPYAIILFISAFRGKDAAVPSLITFSCACFAKSSTIWIPLLYISTSTQFKLRFLSADGAYSTPSIVHPVKKPLIHQLVVVHNQDGSIIVQTTAQLQSQNKHSLPTSNQPLMEPEETLRSDHRNRSDCSWCVLWIICAVGVVFYCKHLFSSTVLVSVKNQLRENVKPLRMRMKPTVPHRHRCIDFLTCFADSFNQSRCQQRVTQKTRNRWRLETKGTPPHSIRSIKMSRRRKFLDSSISRFEWYVSFLLCVSWKNPTERKWVYIKIFFRSLACQNSLWETQVDIWGCE